MAERWEAGMQAVQQGKKGKLIENTNSRASPPTHVHAPPPPIIAIQLYLK